MKRSTVIESVEWVKFHARRHVVAESERLLGADSLSVAASSNEGAGAVEPGGDAEAPVPERDEAPWRLEKTPRTIKDLVELLCLETSRCLLPSGEGLERAPLGTGLNGGKCLRRLLCVRFEVE